MRAFLGDLECPVFFTDLNGQHGSETIATWITDPQAGTCSMYRLPTTCDATLSRCYQKAAADNGAAAAPAADAPNVVYDWHFKCPLEQKRSV